VRLIHQTVHKCFQGLFFAATTSCTAVFRENPSNKRVTKHPIFGYISLHINRSHNILSTGGEIKSLLIGMLACTALVGCTSDDEPVVNNGNQATNGEKQYVAVNLAMPGNASRAASHAGFADGSTEENKINDATFFFLNANGQSCADAYYVAKGITSTNNEGDDDDTTGALGSFDEKTSTLIVMENPTEVPSSIVVLINVGNITGADGKLADKKKRPALSDIQAVADNYATATWNAMPTGGMVMSNSTYVDAAKNVIVGAPVSISNIITSDKDTYNVGDTYTGNVPPVTIYVEKVLAKVTVTNSITDAKKENLGGYTYTTADANGATTSATETFTVTINNWWLDSTPTTSNLLKAIENYSYTWEWNSIPNYRSYWANSYAKDDQVYINNKYNSGAAVGGSLYTQENTSQPLTVKTQGEDNDDNTYDANNRTKVVVAATLKDSKGNDANMVKWYGKFYSKDAFLITLANLNDVKKYYIKNGNEYTSLTKDNLELVYNTDNGAAGEITGSSQINQTDGTNNIRNYEAVVTLKGVTDGTLYTQSNGTWTAVANKTADDAIRSISKVLYWNGGKTYYFVELEHITHTAGETATTYYGVVRNHLYQVNLTGLKGLGTPVPNPNKIIVPEKPGDSDMETYISANMIIQAYRVVNQEVTLQ